MKVLFPLALIGAIATTIVFALAIHANAAPLPSYNVADTVASVVEINTAEGLGTGTVVGPNVVLTAAHVVDSAGEGGRVTITFHDGHKETGVVDHAVRGFDLALIRVNTGSVPILTPGCRDVVLGEPIYAVGFPAGVPYFVSAGIIASVATTTDAGYSFTAFISAPTYQGMSGGPVVSATGELIGVVVMKIGAQDGFGPGMIIPLSQVNACPKEETNNDQGTTVPGH